MTIAVTSHADTEAEFAAWTAAGFKLSKLETLFFQCLIDAIGTHGIKPPKGRGIPKEIRRVVDYDHVKLLVAARLPNTFDGTPEGVERRYLQLRDFLRRNREAMMNFKIVAASNPYIWHTGKHVRGFDRPSLKTSPGRARRYLHVCAEAGNASSIDFIKISAAD